MAQPAVNTVPYVTTRPNRDIQSMASSCLICYIIGFFFWIVYLPSLIISFQMVGRKYIPESKRTMIVVFGVLELVAWLFVPCFIWYYTGYCFEDLYETYCYIQWWGWISLVIFYSFALCFGIPRVIWCHQAGQTYSSTVVAAPQQNMVMVQQVV